MHQVLAAACVALLLAWPAANASAGTPPDPALDRILFNGKLYTGGGDSAEASALAIRADRIIAVGRDADVLALAGPGTERVDLGGRRVVPGINDAHEHLGWQPAPGVRMELPEPDPTGAELETALAAQPTAGTEGIRGTIGGYVFTDLAWNRERLDTLQPTRPVMLTIVTNHGLLLNSAAIRELGVDPTVPVPGGWYGRDEAGEFDGRVFEYAGWQIMLRFPRPGEDVEVERLRRYGETASRSGITSVQNMAWIALPRFVDLWQKSGAPQRLRAIRSPGITDDPAPIPGLDLTGLLPGTRITVSGTKWILDGTPLEQAAPMRQPYPDTGRNGRLNFNTEEMRARIEEVLARDDQLILHVIGDATTEATLDTMEAIAPAREWPARRVRFEHGDGLAKDLLERTKALGVVVVQNPSHQMLPPEHPAARGIVDRELSPFADLLTAGIPLAIGSDGPSNPWLNMMFAVALPTRPDQSLTREQLLRAYTEGSAYAEFAEHEKGRLAPGYLADLAVLSQDVLDETSVPTQALPGTHSLLTLVGGEVAWRDPAL